MIIVRGDQIDILMICRIRGNPTHDHCKYIYMHKLARRCATVESGAPIIRCASALSRRIYV